MFKIQSNVIVITHRVREEVIPQAHGLDHASLAAPTTSKNIHLLDHNIQIITEYNYDIIKLYDFVSRVTSVRKSKLHEEGLTKTGQHQSHGECTEDQITDSRYWKYSGTKPFRKTRDSVKV